MPTIKEIKKDITEACERLEIELGAFSNLVQKDFGDLTNREINDYAAIPAEIQLDYDSLVESMCALAKQIELSV